MAVEHPPNAVENLIGLLVAVAVGVQTWMLIQEATGGEAGRSVRRWWTRTTRALGPQVDRARTWFDAAAITERMIADEVIPHLEGHCEP